MVFSEGSLSAAAPQDVPSTYFVRSYVSEHRQSVGRLSRGAFLWHPWAPVRKWLTHAVFLWELRDSDAFLEFSFCKSSWKVRHGRETLPNTF